MPEVETAEFLGACHEAYEKFLARCMAEIFVRPNEALAEVFSYAHGKRYADPAQNAEIESTIERIVNLAAKKRG
jgi:hypothetical protein